MHLEGHPVRPMGIEVSEQDLHAAMPNQNLGDLYRILDMSVPCGLCVHKNDDDLSLIHANDRFFRLLGYESYAAAREQGVHRLAPLLSADVLDTIRRNYKQLCEGQREEATIDFPLKSAGGRLVWIRSHAVYRKEFDSFCLSVFDYTQHQQAQRELQLTSSEMQIAIELGGRQIYVYRGSDDTLISSYNRGKTIGMPLNMPNISSAMIKTGLIAEEHRAGFIAFFESVRSGIESAQLEFQVKRPGDATYRWFSMKSKSIEHFPIIMGDPEGYTAEAKLPQDSEFYAVLLMTDITEFKNNEVARLAQREVVSTMTAGSDYFEYDLTTDSCTFSAGTNADIAFSLTDGTWDAVLDFINKHNVFEDDREEVWNLLKREHLVNLFGSGQTTFSHELRSNGKGAHFSWYRARVLLAKDYLSGDLLANILLAPLPESEAEVVALRKNITVMETELRKSSARLMLSQMQPHFLYNALSAIRSIVKSNPEYAYDLLYDFATHLRGSVRALSSDDPIPFKLELDNIKAYLNIEQMRQGDRLHVCYDIQYDDFMVPPLSIQPLAENATRHGVFPMGSKGGTVTIKTFTEGNDVVIEIIDDGVGFDFDAVSAEKKDSYGLKNLIYRLDMLLGARLNIDSKPGKGTTARVVIPGAARHEDEEG